MRRTCAGLAPPFRQDRRRRQPWRPRSPIVAQARGRRGGAGQGGPDRLGTRRDRRRAVLQDAQARAARSCICFPFDHPLRSMVKNNWAIVKPTIERHDNRAAGPLPRDHEEPLQRGRLRAVHEADGRRRRRASTTTTSPSSASRGPTSRSSGCSPAGTTPSAPTATASRAPRSAGRSSTATPPTATTTRTPSTPTTSGGTRASRPTRSSRRSTTSRRPRRWSTRPSRTTPRRSSSRASKLAADRPGRRRPRRPAEADGPASSWR